MFRKFNTMLLLLCILIICLFSNTTYAINNNMNNYNENSKEVQELKSLIQDYFNIKNKGRGELNNKNLLSSYLKDNENKSYILDKYEYYNALHNMSNMEILWQETNVTVIDMQINRNNAIFDVYEEYKYQEKDVLGTSSIGTFHTIVLIKENGKWMITDIKSNDEFDRIYKYKGFNLQKELKEIKAPLMSGEEIKKYGKKKQIILIIYIAQKAFLYKIHGSIQIMTKMLPLIMH